MEQYFLVKSVFCDLELTKEIYVPFPDKETRDKAFLAHCAVLQEDGAKTVGKTDSSFSCTYEDISFNGYIIKLEYKDIQVTYMCYGFSKIDKNFFDVLGRPIKIQKVM